MTNISPPPKNEAGIESAVRAMRCIFGDRLQTGDAVRVHHGHVTNHIFNQPPDAVIVPMTTGGGGSNCYPLRLQSRPSHPLWQRHIA